MNFQLQIGLAQSLRVVTNAHSSHALLHLLYHRITEFATLYFFRAFHLAGQSGEKPPMNAIEKQFSVNYGASRKQFPISNADTGEVGELT
jgi:hypothetical protein